MNEMQAATAQVADVIVPQFIQDAFQRTAKVRQQLGHIQPQDAKMGQIWRVKPPIPLWDTIDPEHRLSSVTFCLFIEEVNGPEMQPDEVYGFLCLGASAIEDLPVLERPLKAWEYAPYCWWVDILRKGGTQPTTAAEYIMPAFPFYAKKDWLIGCEGDLGGTEGMFESVHKVLNQMINWCESNGPDLDLDHHRNKIGGHTLMKILAHVTTCWIESE
jgi:hypothetical protein